MCHCSGSDDGAFSSGCICGHHLGEMIIEGAPFQLQFQPLAAHFHRKDDLMSKRVPPKIRMIKHWVFGFLPGRVGLRNRACLHHLKKSPAREEFAEVLSQVKPGDICIDCGANVGEYTRKLAATGAHVYAFEPDPWSFQTLSKNVADLENVTLINKAVGVRDGTISFFRDKEFSNRPGWHSLASSVIKDPRKDQEQIDVQVIDFIDFLNSIDGHVAILKMDIEGAETEILEHLIKSEQVNKLSYVFVETHEVIYTDLLERTWKLRDDVRQVAGVRFNLDWH